MPLRETQAPLAIDGGALLLELLTAATVSDAHAKAEPPGPDEGVLFPPSTARQLEDGRIEEVARTRPDRVDAVVIRNVTGEGRDATGRARAFEGAASGTLAHLSGRRGPSR